MTELDNKANPTSGRVLSFVGGLALFLALTFAPHARAQQVPRAILNIEVWDASATADEESPIFLASNLNDWDPRDKAFVLTPGDDFIDIAPDGTTTRIAKINAPEPDDGATRVTTWTIRFPIDDPRHRHLLFKFTRGSWQTVETAADFSDIPNRSLNLDELRRRFLRDDFDESVITVTLDPIDNWADRRPADRGAQRAASTVTGELDIFTARTPHLPGERTIRVWLPPGYHDNPDARYPVLYMHDAQNLFDRQTAFIGEEWHVDETATRLIAEGTIEPLIVVGIDNAGDKRSWEYLPFPPGRNRPDSEGGGADQYLDFIEKSLMPRVNTRYRTRTGPENTAMGGSSYGGIITLYAAMTRPGTYGRLLVESPALWVGDGRFMEMLEAHDTWPQRIFLGVGERESDDSDDAAGWVRICTQAAVLLRADGLDDSRLRFVVGEDAPHNETAWADRLPEALSFLFAN